MLFRSCEEEFLPDRWKNPSEEALKAGISGEYFELRDFVDSILHDTDPPMDVYDVMDTPYPDWCPSSQLPTGVSRLRCQISEIKQPNSEIAISL